MIGRRQQKTPQPQRVEVKVRIEGSDGGKVRVTPSATVDRYIRSLDEDDGGRTSSGSAPNTGAGTTAKYDAGQFIVPGSDAQGHSERIQCRVPPGMLRQLDLILGSRKFPFRSIGDIYRWSVWTGIQMLERMEATGNTFISRIDAANAIIREQIYLQEYMATLHELERTVNAYIGQGAEGEAVRLIATVQSQFERIEERYWREKMVREVRERFGHVIGGEAGKVRAPRVGELVERAEDENEDDREGD